MSHAECHDRSLQTETGDFIREESSVIIIDTDPSGVGSNTSFRNSFGYCFLLH